MKKNKTIAFMLAATLLVGGTFLGTKAWFTDSAEASNDLIITMGNVDLLVEEGPWVNENKNTEADQSKNSQGNIFMDVKPGDSFRKKVTIKNNGSLKQVVNVTESHIQKGYPDILLVGQDIGAKIGKDKTLNPGEKIEAQIHVLVTGDKDQKFNEAGSINNEKKPTYDFNELVSKFIITAEQEGAKK